MASRRQTDMDSGWSWVILAASFGGLFLQSLIYMNGIFNVVFLEVFQKDMATTAWTGSICFGLWNSMGPVSGLLMFRFGSRVTAIIGGVLVSAGYVLAAFAKSFEQVLLSIGVVSGIGYGIAYLPFTITVGYYFKKYRNIAFGIINTGIGMGVLVFPPLLQGWIQNYGWRGGMLLVAAATLHLVLLGTLLRPIQAEVSTDNEEVKKQLDIPPLLAKADDLKSVSFDNEEQSVSATTHLEEDGNTTTPSTVIKQGDHKSHRNGKSLFKAFRTLLTRSYVFYCLTQLFCSAGLSLCYVHFPEYAHLKGAGSIQLATLMSVIGATNIIGRLLVTLATSHPDIDMRLAQIGTTGIAGVAFLVLPLLIKSFVGQLIFAVFFGLYGNCFIALLGPLNIFIAGLENLPAAMGFGLVMCGLGYVLGPPFAGWLYDISGSFALSFNVAGFCYIMSSLMMMLSVIGNKTDEKNNLRSNYVAANL